MNVVDDLTNGTTKVTWDLPGYTGFVPNVDVNKRAVSQSKHLFPRDLVT